MVFEVDRSHSRDMMQRVCDQYSHVHWRDSLDDCYGQNRFVQMVYGKH